MGRAEGACAGAAILSLQLKFERGWSLHIMGAHNGRRLYPRDDIILPPIRNQPTFYYVDL